MLAPVAASLDQLVMLTSPGAPVLPVVEALSVVEHGARDALPALRQSRAGAQLVDDVDQMRNSAGMLREALEELASSDGMTTFDPEFAADDASWDAWFVKAAGIARDADRFLCSSSIPDRRKP